MEKKEKHETKQKINIDEPLELVHFFSWFRCCHHYIYYICAFIESAPGAAPVAVLLLSLLQVKNAPVCFLFVLRSVLLCIEHVHFSILHRNANSLALFSNENRAREKEEEKCKKQQQQELKYK